MAEEHTPRVTVAIPTYNRARFLRESIESALAQTLRDIEVVVSDNGSTVETRDVVAAFDDPRLSYSRLESNIGLHGNLSRCLELGSAPYLSLLQDDDTMDPANLERKVEALERFPEAALVHGPFRFIDVEGRVLSERVDWWKSGEERETGEQFIRGMVEWGVRVDMSSWLLVRERLGKLRFAAEDGLATDFGFLLRVGLRGDVAYVDEPLTSVRRHAGSLSVAGDSLMLEGGHYAPSFAYVLACRAATERFLEAYAEVVADSVSLRKASRRWASGELAGVVRVQAGEEPSLRRTLGDVRRAASAEPRILRTRKVALTLAWAAAGRRGRRLARRVLRRPRRP